MSKNFRRSAVALVLATTMLLSSQGVLTAFAVGENETSTAVDVLALEPSQITEGTDVANESGDISETETPDVTEPCDKTEGCTLSKDHEGECQVTPVDPPVENENGEGETQPCYKTEGCTLPNGHEGECVVEENTEDTEDTQEPSEEAAAAVQAVVDRINSLPTTDDLANYTPTIELKPEDEGYQEAYQAALDAYYSQIKKDVEAARSAYDALTEEQKVAFDATVLDKLESLENLFAMRDQANTLPDTTPPENILGFTPNGGEYTFVSGESQWNADPVDFSEPTTPGIKVDISHVEEEGYIIYTIPEGFTENEININATQDVMNAFQGTYMPGDNGPFSIKLINNSSKEYNYVENSFYVAPNPNPGSVYEESDPKYKYHADQTGTTYGSATAGWIDGAVGFDGSHMLVSSSDPTNSASSVFRTSNQAIVFLIKNFGENPPQIDRTLSNKESNHLYMTDEYLGAALQKAGYSGIEELNHYYIDYYNSKNGTSATSLDELGFNIVYNILNGNRFCIAETNPEVQEAAYNMFYNHCFRCETESGEGDFSIGGWMRHENSAENDIENLLDTFLPNSTVDLPAIEYQLDPTYVTNGYMKYNFGATFGLKLSSPADPEQPPIIDPTPDPTPDPDPDPDPTPRPDDDDDWEPLPDAPVKDKPEKVEVETEVPEETETPTTEQPDKYNPETGDTTTVFAAMALAAVSLGGVVLLGRKKK